MNQQTDSDFRNWAKAISLNNRDAFSDFFRSTYDRYLRYACRFVSDRNEAADLVQDAFVSIWTNRSSLNAEKSMKSYMYTIVRNLCLNFIRDHQSKVTDLNQAGALTIHQETEIDDPVDIEELLSELVEQLPERQREAFELSRFDGLTHDEIADIMELSPRTVNNHLVAALKTLRAEATILLNSKEVA
ncbi:RNA polymerase sigma-70 factor [Balneola sp. MJW-20]|uniref:RNA polymerase sigma-70 factor n=1 Tax=Gracilimonas aurantiaca TaxID=3234185 RepID=UPI0034658412